MLLRRALCSRGERFALVAAREVGAGEARIPGSASLFAALLAPLASRSLDMLELRRIAAALGPARPPGADREVLARLVAAIVGGQLVAVRVEAPPTWGYAGPPPPTARPDPEHGESSPPPGDLGHWVELILVDEDNAGIAGQRYLVITPEGRQYRGYTDSLGAARVMRLPPGPYQVSFPDLDASVCERSEAP